MAVATHIPVEELALATAIYCRLHNITPREARASLDTTPRAHFDEASVWANSNAKTIALIGSDPKTIAAGGYSLNQARSWISRLFGLGKTRGVNAPDVDEMEQMAREIAQQRRPVDKRKAQKLAAIRELVDESFDM